MAQLTDLRTDWVSGVKGERNLILQALHKVANGTSPMAQWIKYPPAEPGAIGGGNGNSLQYSCWDNPMDRGAWRATICVKS